MGLDQWVKTPSGRELWYGRNNYHIHRWMGELFEFNTTKRDNFMGTEVPPDWNCQRVELEVGDMFDLSIDLLAGTKDKMDNAFFDTSKEEVQEVRNLITIANQHLKDHKKLVYDSWL